MSKNLVRALIFFSFVATVGVGFQNCGPMTALKLGVTEGSSEEDFYRIATKVIDEADISWSMRGGRALLNRFKRAERWAALQTGGVNLYPSLIPNTQTLNIDYSGLLEQSGGSEFLRFKPDAFMSPAISDLSEFTSDRFTVLMLLKDIQLPLPGEGPLRLFGFFPVNDQAGVLVIDVNAGANGSYEFVMIDWSDPQNMATRKILVPSQDVKGIIAIAARFDKTAGEMQIAINGRIADDGVVSVGSIPPLGKSPRSFGIHAPAGTYGSKGSFLVGEMAIYKKASSDGELASMSSDLALAYEGVAIVPTPTPTPIQTGTPTPPPATPTPSGGTPQPSTPTPMPTPDAVKGAALYSNSNVSCSGCHGALANSEKRGRTAAQITNAINIQAGMSQLSFLTTADRENIAAALK